MGSQTRSEAIAFADKMRWSLRQPVLFSCDDCMNAKPCHFAFDPCNIWTVNQKKNNCVSEGTGAEWSYLKKKSKKQGEKMILRVGHKTAGMIKDFLSKIHASNGQILLTMADTDPMSENFVITKGLLGRMDSHRKHDGEDITIQIIEIPEIENSKS